MYPPDSHFHHYIHRIQILSQISFSIFSPFCTRNNQTIISRNKVHKFHDSLPISSPFHHKGNTYNLFHSYNSLTRSLQHRCYLVPKIILEGMSGKNTNEIKKFHFFIKKNSFRVLGSSSAQVKQFSSQSGRH